MRVLLIPIVFTLAACCPERVFVRPEQVTVYRDVVVPVDPGLLKEHPIAEGPLSACPQVAAQREQELKDCNSHKRAIRNITTKEH